MVRVKGCRSGTPGSSRPRRVDTLLLLFFSFKIEEKRERAVCDMETSLYRKQVFTSKECKQQSWLSAYVVRDFIYFYTNVQLMKRDI